MVFFPSQVITPFRHFFFIILLQRLWAIGLGVHFQCIDDSFENTKEYNDISRGLLPPYLGCRRDIQVELRNHIQSSS